MYNNELYHYGVKGMKWGRRKNVYDINASYYNKRADKLSARADRNRRMASMNRSAANSGSGLIAKANRINENYYQKRADKLSARADRNRTMASMNENASKQRNAAKAAKVNDKQKNKAAKPNKDKQVRNAVGKAMTMSMGAAKTVAAAQEGANAVRNMTRNNGKGAGQNMMNMAWHAAGARREKRMYDWYNNNN